MEFLSNSAKKDVSSVSSASSVSSVSRSSVSRVSNQFGTMETSTQIKDHFRPVRSRELLSASKSYSFLQESCSSQGEDLIHLLPFNSSDDNHLELKSLSKDNDDNSFPRYVEVPPKYVSKRIHPSKLLSILSKGGPKRKVIAIMEPKPALRITSFRGGSYYFQSSDMPTVLNLMAQDAAQDLPMYWNQIANSDEMRFVIDVDTDKRVFSPYEIVHLCKVLRTTMGVYFTNISEKPIPIFVAKCGPRLVKESLTTRLHIVCHVHVSLKEARQLAHDFHMRLKNDIDFNMDGVEVDPAIYKDREDRTLSLRMVYSSKLEKCPLCEDDMYNRTLCNFCNRFGRVESCSNYEPYLILHSNGDVDKEFMKKRFADYKTIFQDFSIWATSSDHRNDFHIPEYVSLWQNDKKRNSVEKKSQNQDRRKITPINNPYVERLEKTIRRISLDGQRRWEGVYIDSIVDRSTKNIPRAVVSVSGMGCTYCHYVRRNHNNNRIFFILETSYIIHRCHSKNHTCGGEDPNRLIMFPVQPSLIRGVLGLDPPPRSIQHSRFSIRSKSKMNLSTKELRKRRKQLFQRKHEQAAIMKRMTRK
jgi:hypothetical protein